MEIESNDYDDEMDDIIDDDLIMDSIDESDEPVEKVVRSAKYKYEIRRRLEEYFEDMRLKREIEMF